MNAVYTKVISTGTFSWRFSYVNITFIFKAFNVSIYSSPKGASDSIMMSSALSYGMSCFTPFTKSTLKSYCLSSSTFNFFFEVHYMYVKIECFFVVSIKFSYTSFGTMSPNNDFSNADGYFLSLETVTLFLIAADKVEAIEFFN